MDTILIVLIKRCDLAKVQYRWVIKVIEEVVIEENKQTDPIEESTDVQTTREHNLVEPTQEPAVTKILGTNTISWLIEMAKTNQQL